MCDVLTYISLQFLWRRGGDSNPESLYTFNHVFGFSSSQGDTEGMNIPPESLEELRQIHLDQTGELLSDEEVIALARQLFRLYGILYKGSGSNHGFTIANESLDPPPQELL